MAPVSRVGAMGLLLPVLGVRGGKSMDCKGAPLCGVLTLESGMGDGNYKHKMASVHGIWPENGAYGTSQCIKPQDPTEATSIPSCYQNAEAKADPQHELEFINHEWTKHGSCAGSKDVKDFFDQICNISAAPVAVIEKKKEAGGSFDDMVSAVKDAGYPVFDVDRGEDQIMVSVCACSDGRWKIAAESDFVEKCCGGGSGPAPGPSPGPPAPSPPSPPAPDPNSKCVNGRHGPKCRSDSDCHGVSGCLRCAHSGYCTNVPKLEVIV